MLCYPGKSRPKATPTQQTPATQVEAKPAANPDTDYKIGQEFKLGDYTYRITNFTLTSRVGNEFSREVAEEGGKFVVVSFTIRNDTNKTQQVLADDFEIKDAQGRRFANDSNASTALMMSGGKKDFILREILKTYPGIKEYPHSAIRLGRILRRTFLYNGRAKATLIPIAAPESVSLCADEKLTAFLELEWAIRACGKLA